MGLDLLSKRGRFLGLWGGESAEDARERLMAAVRTYLAFAPEHAALAERIATEAADHVHTADGDCVSRAPHLPLDEQARLAARAWIRHHSSEDALDWMYGDDFLVDELECARDRRASRAVDAFLATHRG